MDQFEGLELAPGFLAAVVIGVYLLAAYNQLKLLTAGQACFDQVGMVRETSRQQFHALQVAPGGDFMQYCLDCFIGQAIERSHLNQAP